MSAPDPRPTSPLAFAFDNRFARELPDFGVPWPPSPAPDPRLLWLNRPLAAELGLDAGALAGDEGLQLLSGITVPGGAQPLAQAYAGHQFGGFSPQLGDGRALLLGELVDVHGQRRDWAFKGSGRTPFSRGGDGKAALGPVLREVLMGEAMHALGVPTTRALAAVATGESVFREGPMPGALLSRIAASHIRVGTFQFFAARGRVDAVRQLLQHVLDRHYPELAPALADGANPALALLQACAGRQAALVAQWMGVGFIHGVMNTDNMTLSGETIDYGPCAFLEAYDPATVFSSIDHHGRYAYGQQPAIARWNLARLAECLLPLIDADEARAAERATEVITAFPALYERHWLAVMRRKLALDDAATPADEAGDRALAEAFLSLLQAHRADFTLGFRSLAQAVDDPSAGDAPADPPTLPTLASLVPDDHARGAWLARWHARSARGAQAGRPASHRAAALRAANPLYIPRNHRVEAVLYAAVEDGDLAPFEALVDTLRCPFDAQPGRDADAQPAPPELTAGYQTFCGT